MIYEIDDIGKKPYKVKIRDVYGDVNIYKLKLLSKCPKDARVLYLTDDIEWNESNCSEDSEYLKLSNDRSITYHRLSESSKIMVTYKGYLKIDDNTYVCLTKSILRVFLLSSLLLMFSLSCVLYMIHIHLDDTEPVDENTNLEQTITPTSMPTPTPIFVPIDDGEDAGFNEDGDYVSIPYEQKYVVSSDNPYIVLHNPVENTDKFDLWWIFTDDNSNIIYQSDFLPGGSTSYVNFKKLLSTGTYKLRLTIKARYVDSTPANGMSSDITIIVKE